MTEKFVTAIVQVECHTDDGIIASGNASDEFILGLGHDYDTTVRALLDAGFERIDSVGEAIDARLRGDSG